jgi:pimeloyl-ACP methyl ester carboxylesterase
VGAVRVACRFAIGRASRQVVGSLVPIGLGERTFNWLGLSYGTQIGANYAQLFPRRVRAMVFDGALDHSALNVGLLATRSPPSRTRSTGSPHGAGRHRPAR